MKLECNYSSTKKKARKVEHNFSLCSYRVPTLVVEQLASVQMLLRFPPGQSSSSMWGRSMTQVWGLSP